MSWRTALAALGRIVGTAAALLLCSAALAGARQLARRPPMGWNSYDAYGTTITEAQFRANVRWMSQHLRRYGWRYAVIDAEWFVRNPTPSGGAKGSVITLDRWCIGLPVPPVRSSLPARTAAVVPAAPPPLHSCRRGRPGW